MKKEKIIKKKLKKFIGKSYYKLLNEAPKNIAELEIFFNQYLNYIAEHFPFKFDFQIIDFKKDHISVDFGIEKFKFNITVKQLY